MSQMMLFLQLIFDVVLFYDLIIIGLVLDSCVVCLGNVFVVIVGFGVYGLGFVEQVCVVGVGVILFDLLVLAELLVLADVIVVLGLCMCMGVMVDQFYGYFLCVMMMVGVIGINGKIFIVQLLVQVWYLFGICSGSIGMLGVGFYGDVVLIGFIILLVLQMYVVLVQLCDGGVQVVVMEVSLYVFDQGWVDVVYYDVVVFINFICDYFDYYGDMVQYGVVKVKLFYCVGLKVVVVNFDDLFGSELLCIFDVGVQLVGVSLCGVQQVVVCVDLLMFDGCGIVFDLVVGGECYLVQLLLFGCFNVDNLLVVVGVLLVLDYVLVMIVVLFLQLQLIVGCMNCFGGVNGQFIVVIDYVYIFDVFEQVLVSLQGYFVGWLVCVFGCGGECDIGKCLQMVVIVEQYVDVVIVIDDNLCGEDGDVIVVDILVGLCVFDVVIVQCDCVVVIIWVIGLVGVGDIVLIVGKGYEFYQEIVGVQYLFNDIEVVVCVLVVLYGEVV